MILRRPAAERGHSDFGWLDSRHTFSFGRYLDRRHVGFRALRVINDDRVDPARGFGEHPHENMEILSWVVSGAIEHRDSLGTGSVVRPGELQRMTAGSGVTHSEFNPSDDEPLRFLQIWIHPERDGLAPSYEQRSFSLDEPRGGFHLLASPDGRDGSITVHQDVTIHGGRFDDGQQTSLALANGRHAWVQVVTGSIELNGHALGEGDGAAVSEESTLDILATTDGAELLVFDLA